MFKTKEEAQAFIRKIMGPPKRTIEGTEREHLMLILALTEPVRETNNQHSWCVEYNIGGKMYNVHHFPGDDILVEEVLEDK